jgi:hypothetical protein
VTRISSYVKPFLLASLGRGPGLKLTEARDLNPRPYGPEAARWRVLAYPPGPSGVLLNSNGRAFVSSCELW